MNQYLTPSASFNSAGGLSFDVIVQNFIRGVTGMEGRLIRPRWQPTEPVYPDLDETWCATGELSREGDPNTIVRQLDLKMEVHRHEIITIMTSFFGPNADSMASRFREGMTLELNRAVLSDNGMDVLRIGTITRLATLVNNQWQDRFDMTWRVARHSVQVFDSPSVVSADKPNLI